MGLFQLQTSDSFFGVSAPIGFFPTKRFQSLGFSIPCVDGSHGMTWGFNGESSVPPTLPVLTNFSRASLGNRSYPPMLDRKVTSCFGWRKCRGVLKVGWFFWTDSPIPYLRFYFSKWDDFGKIPFIFFHLDWKIFKGFLVELDVGSGWLRKFPLRDLPKTLDGARSLTRWVYIGSYRPYDYYLLHTR